MVESITTMYHLSRKATYLYIRPGLFVRFFLALGGLVVGAFVILLLPIVALWFFLVVGMMMIRAKVGFLVMIYVILGPVARAALVIAIAAQFAEDTVEDGREEATDATSDGSDQSAFWPERTGGWALPEAQSTCGPYR